MWVSLFQLLTVPIRNVHVWWKSFDSKCAFFSLAVISLTHLHNWFSVIFSMIINSISRRWLAMSVINRMVYHPEMHSCLFRSHIAPLYVKVFWLISMRFSMRVTSSLWSKRVIKHFWLCWAIRKLMGETFWSFIKKVSDDWNENANPKYVWLYIFFYK